MSAQSFATRLRQSLGDHDAARMTLKPFMPLEHYFAHFDFLPYVSRYDQSYSTKSLLSHFELFQIFKHEFGFILPSRELMDRLADILHQEIGDDGRVLDAGSGSGFMTKELCRLGIDTFAVDRCDYENRQRQFGYPMIHVYQRDALGDAVDYVSNQFAAVLLIWPPYDQPFASAIAKAMHPGQLLIFEGEDAGGCTGNDTFFEYVSDGKHWTKLAALSDQLNAVHVTFATQHDHWSIWRKIDA